jgi:hypothetical protein
MHEFLIMSRMVVRILCVQPTSAETERVYVFSIGGHQIFNETRSLLTSSHVNQLLCVHSWLKPKYGKQDAAQDSKSKKLAKSLRLATKILLLCLSLRLEALAAPDDSSDQDNLNFCYI